MENIRGRELIRRGPFAKLWWANSISSLGDWVNIFATLALAARIGGGGDASTVAIIVSLVARFLPGMVAGMLGGVVADRWNRKVTMVVSDFGRAVLVCSLMFVSTLSQLFLIIVLVELLGLFRQPAREAVVPTLIASRHLAAANGLNLVSMYGTAPIGSALFALLTEFSELLPHVGQFGAWVLPAFLFDMATFVASGLITLTIPIKRTLLPEQRRMRLEARSLAAPVRDLVEGWALVGRKGPVRRLVWGMAVALLGGGGLFVMGQPFSQQVLEATESGYGALLNLARPGGDDRDGAPGGSRKEPVAPRADLLPGSVGGGRGNHLHKLLQVGDLGGGLGAPAGRGDRHGLRGRIHPTPLGGDRRDQGEDFRGALHLGTDGAPGLADGGGVWGRWRWRGFCPVC